MANNNKVAVSFDEMIQADRKKRKAEELAQQIFGKNRRGSAPTAGNRRNNNQSPVGGSLASRVGITKNSPQPRAASFASDRRQNNASDRRQNNQNLNLNQNQNQNNALDRRQNNQNQTQNPTNRNQRRPFRDSAANAGQQSSSRAGPVPRTAVPQTPAAPQNIQPEASFAGIEINIRGAAGPYCVVASNFAPGTTAADIESVMAPIGGEMLACKLISASPTVIVEMVFVERSGADNVISMFNNKKADGRVLYVYMKESGPSQTVANAPSNPAHSRPPPSTTSASQPAPSAPSPRPIQQSSDDVMELDPESTAANDAAYNANPGEDVDVNGSARSHSRGDNAPPRAPREPREPYRPPPRDDRPLYYDDHAQGQDGRYGFQDHHQYPRRGGGYGGGYRDDRRGRFRNDGTMYSDSMMGRGNGRYRR